jgi:hypothetical protein
MWEHKIEKLENGSSFGLSKSFEIWIEMFNKFGKEGWELVTIMEGLKGNYSYAVFKRRTG